MFNFGWNFCLSILIYFIPKVYKLAWLDLVELVFVAHYLNILNVGNYILRCTIHADTQ